MTSPLVTVKTQFCLSFVSVWTKSTSGVSIWVWAQFWLSLSWDLVHIQLTFSLYIGCSTIIWYPNMCAYKLFSPSPYFWVWPHVNRYHAVKIWTPLAWSARRRRWSSDAENLHAWKPDHRDGQKNISSSSWTTFFSTHLR